VKGTATLAVVAAPQVDAGLAEFIRLCVGFVAGGGSLTLLEVGPGRGVLSGGADLPQDIEHNLRGLADFDVKPLPVSDEALHDLLRGSERVLRVASPTRSGIPELLVLDDATLETIEPKALMRGMVEAGQVLRG
jgi:hypothetical protein